MVPIEYFGMLISSKAYKAKYKTNILLTKDKSNNLKEDIIVKTDVIYKIDSDSIMFKIDDERIQEYIESHLNL